MRRRPIPRKAPRNGCGIIQSRRNTGPLTLRKTATPAPGWLP